MFEVFSFFSRVTRACAVSWDSMRAEPNITTVSPIPSLLSCTNGWIYSPRMRMGLAGVLFKNFWSSCGAFGACCGFSLWPSDMGLYSPVETNSDCRNRSGLRQRLPLTMRRIKYSVVQEHYPRQVLVVLGAGYLLSYQGIRMIRLARASLTLAFFLAVAGHPACGEAPSGPLAPKPGGQGPLPP